MKALFFRVATMSLTIGLLLCLKVQVLAQDQPQDEDLYDLSLEELMNIPIESASKKTENLFDAPVSSYSITKDEIVNSGVTSIPEALRLCPGIVVRETSNGNYDIHIRGFENLGKYSSTNNQINLISLVMIDNRPIFNYNQGGVFWDALPIDLVDVERIEVVRGPTAPLFGPNAVSGVINIITRKPNTEGFAASANVVGGLPNTLIGNLAVSQKFNDKFDVTLSANYQNRERSDDEFYMYGSDQFIEDVSTLPNADEAFPDPELSLEKLGVNAFVNYSFNTDAQVSLSTGYQQAESNKLYFNDDVSSTSYSENNSTYINLAGSFYGVGVKLSRNTGYDNLKLGTQGIVPEYDFYNTDIVVDYNWNVNKKLSFRPGINYQRATYDDAEYVENAPFGGFLNGSETISSIAAFLKGDYYILDNWRLMAAVRADKFQTPDELYVSYEFASTYKLNDKYLFRAVHARSNSGAFIANTFLDVQLNTSGNQLNVIGNQNLDLIRNTMSEIGFRAQFTNKFQLDLAVFTQKLENLSEVITVDAEPQPDNSLIITQQFVNLPLKGVQNGVTISANYVPTSKLQLKPFVTIQKTKVQDFPVDAQVSLTNVIDEADHESTPSVYGGAFVNYLANRKLNLNLSAYYLGGHTLYHDKDDERPSTVGEIDGKLLLNSKITFHAIDKLNLYVNVRNILGSDSREHYGTDRIGRSYYLGVSYNF